jgi:hypothetical protein
VRMPLDSSLQAGVQHSAFTTALLTR